MREKEIERKKDRQTETQSETQTDTQTGAEGAEIKGCYSHIVCTQNKMLQDN